MPTPLPSDVSSTEKTFFTVPSDIEEENQQNKKSIALKAKRKSLHVDTEIAMEFAQKGQSSADDVNEQKQAFMRQKSCQECKTRTKRKIKNKKCLKRVGIMTLVVIAVVGILLAVLFGTNAIPTDDKEKHLPLQHHTIIPPTTTVKVDTREGQNKPTAAPIQHFPEDPRRNATGISMDLDLICIKEPGFRLFFRKPKDSKGLTGVSYSNGYFTIQNTGFYQLHLVVAIDGTKVDAERKDDDVRFSYSIRFDDNTSIIKRRQEQPGWKGTVEILETRMLLTKGQIVSVVVNPKYLVYDSVYDTRFQMIMTSPAKR